MVQDMLEFPRPAERGESQSEALVPLRERPRILLVNYSWNIGNDLRKKGWNVSTGHFDFPYHAEKDSNWQPVEYSVLLPGLAEKDIVFVDLGVTSLRDGALGNKRFPDGEYDYWVRAVEGFVDPRIVGGCESRAEFDAVISSGGLVVVFAGRPIHQEIAIARTKSGRQLEIKETWVENCFSFLDSFSCGGGEQLVELKAEEGEHIEMSRGASALGLEQFVLDYVKPGTFSCVLSPDDDCADQWRSLAVNKFDQSVACAIVNEDEEPAILVFPATELVERATTELIETVLPRVVPTLFPSTSSRKWEDRTEYLLEPVLSILDQIDIAERDFEQRIAELNAELESTKSSYAYLFELFTTTDVELVNAVQKCLLEVGFSDVRDVDEELQRKQGSGTRQEDLQVHDKSPILVVEVKGISNTPKDVDTHQVHKYVARRMREWDRTDVHGVTIINSERTLDPLSRKPMPFTEAQIQDAEDAGALLVSTWDLFRLARGKIENNWPPEAVQEVLYGKGLISPVPSHYRFLGTVEKVWEEISVIGIRIACSGITVGSVISLETPHRFFQLQAASLQENRNIVEFVGEGGLAGVKVDAEIAKLAPGCSVFLVEQGTATLD